MQCGVFIGHTAIVLVQNGVTHSDGSSLKGPPVCKALVVRA
jgi:hypothetical protein